MYLPLKKTVQVDFRKGLQTKKSIDNVMPLENRKPESENSGFNKNLIDSTYESDRKGTHTKSILADISNLYKKKGITMSAEYPDDGFIKLPRSLIQSSDWTDLRIKQQKLFLYILERVQFRSKKETINGKQFILMPGQLCISYRNLVQDFNSNTKYKNEKIDLSFLQRGVSAFLARNWIDTQNDTGITIITITQSDLYEHFKSLTDTKNNTQNDTLSIQRKEREERKEVTYLKETYKRCDSNSFDESRSPLFYEKEKKKKNQISIPEEEIQENLFLIKNLINEHKIILKDVEIERWVRGHGGFTVISNLNLMIKKKESVKTPGAWMEKAIRNDYAKLKQNEPINKKFAEKFKAEKSWGELKITQKYCTIDGCGYDIPFNFDLETFKETLISKYENLFRSHEGSPNY